MTDEARAFLAGALVAPNPQNYVAMKGLGFWESCGLERPSERYAREERARELLRNPPPPPLVACDICASAGGRAAVIHGEDMNLCETCGTDIDVAPSFVQALLRLIHR